jgi:photosystem II stability/assembly factor-like uncharacterized protein
MSDFDFDALRDATPPSPDAGRRAAVDARARSLRARTRLNRLALSSVSVVAVVALVVGIAASQRDEGPEVIVEGPTSTTTLPPATTTTGPNPTTSTTPPVVGATDAVSATFVSPAQGWVLESNGTVAGTTDGGTTWSDVGAIGGFDGGRIRFADSMHGFAFNEAQLFTTADGGRSWSLTPTPFTGADDLAASGGEVYAVAFDDATTSFHIWSSPADQLSWSEDSLSISPGGGPVASFQFVFSGSSGWLLSVDRVVISGAQLTPTGRWGPWGTTPCTDTGGPAWLAASSPNGLVASCEEGTFTGPRISHGISFSTDGGQTFARHDAPSSGPVASPNSTTAVVADGSGLQRTTDSGTTWHRVFADRQGASANDLGFTTATQGFVISGDGTMLMTYDAGATWQPVTLP